MPANARRIAPAPSPTAEEAASLLHTSSGHIGKSSGTKRASAACQNCKQIKRKCDQRRSCSNCSRTNTECTYDEGQDGRKRSAKKRAVEELVLKRDALDTLLEALRNADDSQLQHLLRLIKRGAPLDDVIRYATAVDEASNDRVASSDATSETDHSRKIKILSISALLSEEPHVKVPAANWTTLTKDDELVSHLISVYFTWYHPAYPCVIRDLFVREMVAGDLNSQFCSPILVNAMLALACHFSDHSDVPETFNKPASRGLHYLREAMRLWMEEIEYPELTTLQAGQIMATALTLLGRDRLSNVYIDQLNDMAGDMMFKAERSGSMKGSTTDMEKSMSLAVWLLYVQSVGFSVTFMRPRTYARPKIERLAVDDPVFETNVSWFPYPDSELTADTHFGKYTNLHYDLHEIGAQISTFLFADSSCESGQERLDELDKMLQSFSQHLPSLDDGGTINPHIVDLNLVYHWFRISLFNFAIMPNSPHLSPPPDKSFQRHARQQCITSDLAMAGLFRRYYRDFNPKHISIWMPQTAVTAAYVLLEEIDNPRVQNLYYDVCQVITSASRRWFCMRGHARMLLVTAEQKGYVLPENAKQILRRVAVDCWKDSDHKHFEASIFPNCALAKGADPRVAEMGDFLERWKNLTIQNKSGRRLTVPVDSDRVAQLKGLSTEDASEDSTDMELDGSGLD